MTEETAIWDHCTSSAVRRAARRLGQLYGSYFDDAGLNGTQFSLLSQIAANGEPALKVLAEAMVMDLSALGHTLKPLIRDGYVELIADTKDRRVKRARLTAAGISKQNELLSRWQQAQDRFDQTFGKEQSAEIRRVMALISSSEFATAFNEKP